ncbi:hypothetical protein L249_8339 [Ophiocordyceps polyrhachis-furcata BCC 54312]|uniref:Uncharacterized protein n=1 Tax=Ophiocordyceps polyrhachis-furcata BCC 54312 TaxID=1330021 RepID=A0A367KZA7_9HYPO|nr:hypothetical protein L249_8339 [Ophiocordyceps polyrhachis-furcata BCC 54312]
MRHKGTAATGSRVRQAAAAGVAPHFFQQGSKRVINHACSTFFSGTLRGLLVPPKNTEGATRCRAFINQLLLWIVVFLQSRSPPAQHYHHYSSTPSSARVFRDTISYNGKFIRKFLLCSELIRADDGMVFMEAAGSFSSSTEKTQREGICDTAGRRYVWHGTARRGGGGRHVGVGREVGVGRHEGVRGDGGDRDGVPHKQAWHGTEADRAEPCMQQQVWHGTAGGPGGASRVHAAAAGVATSSHVWDGTEVWLLLGTARRCERGTAATGSRVRQAAAAGQVWHGTARQADRAERQACMQQVWHGTAQHGSHKVTLMQQVWLREAGPPKKYGGSYEVHQSTSPLLSSGFVVSLHTLNSNHRFDTKHGGFTSSPGGGDKGRR